MPKIEYFFGLLVLIIFFWLWIFLRAILLRNKRTKRIQIDKSNINEYHKNRLFELIEIDTPSFIAGETYEKFKEKTIQLFPLVYRYFQKEKVDGNTIFTYTPDSQGAPNLLFATHIDYKGEHQKAYIDGNRIYGNGTFDSKSLMYVILEAVESILREEGKLDVNLTIVITNDDEANKEGLKQIIYMFLRRGKFFNLVVEEGSGIIDPEVYGIKSNYALIGLGVSGQISLKFESKNKDDLEKFVEEIKKSNFFKIKIDKKSINIVRNIAKDLKFRERFFLNNLWLFRKKSSRIIKGKYQEIEKILKTNANIGGIETQDDSSAVEINFELSTHDSSADILIQLGDLMEKYNIDYKILEIKDASKTTKTYTYGYKIVKNAINHVFKNLYIAPIIVTNISEKRYFDQVSDCVIRFSPLYYDYESFFAASTTENYIESSSIEYGIEFYKYILNNYNKKR